MDTTTAPQTPDIDDPRPAFHAASEQLLELVDRISDDDWTRPTGSADYDVTALCGHLLAVFNRVRHTLSTGSFEGSPTELDSSDFRTDLANARRETEAFLAEESELERTVTVPWGETPAAVAVSAWADELITHSWDLALPLGAVADLDDNLAERALVGWHQKLPRGERPDWLPFDDEVEVSADASAYDRLVAFTGRDPRLTLAP